MIDLDVSSKLVELNLLDIIDEIGENNAKEMLQQYECPQNQDVQIFLRFKAVEFAKQGIAQTHLVFSVLDYAGEVNKHLVGYYTISNKHLSVYKSSLSSKNWNKIKKFGKINTVNNSCEFPALLIGQLGKNFADGNDSLITGGELLNLAIRRLKSVQKTIGGKFIYLECEDILPLLDFYKSNGFVEFGRRSLDGDETDIKGEYLIQLFKYLEYNT